MDKVKRPPKGERFNVDWVDYEVRISCDGASRLIRLVLR